MEESAILTKAQAMVVVTLYQEQQRAQEMLVKTMEEFRAAFQELGRAQAMVHQLPVGEGVLYRYEQDGDDLKLLASKEPDENHPGRDSEL